jgi:hypothetical protein
MNQQQDIDWLTRFLPTNCDAVLLSTFLDKLPSSTVHAEKFAEIERLIADQHRDSSEQFAKLSQRINELENSLKQKDLDYKAIKRKLTEITLSNIAQVVESKPIHALWRETIENTCRSLGGVLRIELIKNCLFVVTPREGYTRRADLDQLRGALKGLMPKGCMLYMNLGNAEFLASAPIERYYSNTETTDQRWRWLKTNLM